MKTVNAKAHISAKASFAIAILFAICLAFTIAGCSSGTSGSSSKGETVNGHPVSEYNADVDNLSRLLSKAKSLDDRLEAMGDPNSFTSQSQADEYNSLVDQYNDAADAYNSAAQAFSRKYGSTIDGAGTRPTDPDNIDLPQKK